MNLNRHVSTIIENPGNNLSKIRIDFDGGIRSWIVYEFTHKYYGPHKTIHFSNEDEIINRYPGVKQYLLEQSFKEELRDIVNE